MRQVLLAALLVLAASCGGSSTSDAGPPDGGPRDAGCGPLEPSGTAPECVRETCFGGRTCVNGPCPYPCCNAGTLETCFIGDGFECAAAPAVDCGGGTCVAPGESCP
jgi:hypothetical protein